MSKQQKNRAYQLDENDEGLVFGEGDEKKQYPFKKGWMANVVVKQSKVETLGSGAVVEDPSSIRVMNYEVEVYDKLIRTEGFGNLRVQVLHDPR